MLNKRNQQNTVDLQDKVAKIIDAVRDEGDSALSRFSLEFDGFRPESEDFRVSEEEIRQSLSKVEKSFIDALEKAAENIKTYHQKQLQNSWIDLARDGVMLGQIIRPLNRVGIYVPGGKASYPSSVLMNAIPAMVAGVKEIAMVTPPGKDGQIDPHTLAAAAIAGVTEVYALGGAQAVAALAYGTGNIRRVDKITGPGNRYVTMAKRLVFGLVDIDMLAGPSEILVIADSSAKPEFIAADLLSQAEHDEMAAVILITPDRELANRVNNQIEIQLETLDKREIAKMALKNFGGIIISGNLDEAVEISNSLSPEHLELMVEEPFSLLGKIKSAGAIFLGQYTPEPVGDYMAGPNHVLPTNGTARFSSPLGVDQFIRRSSVLYYDRDALNREAPDIIKLAEMEGLGAHARSVSIRLE
ncbi:MAG: histidinol dehydrogenase [Peptococcaceae bacterium]|nr:histidinol dehydrogenase [Peptococcaceae bacterium]